MIRDSVRWRLLVWLLLPLRAVLLLRALVAYLVALSVSSRAFDAGLLNSAAALAKRVTEEGGQIVLDLSPQAQQVLQTGRFDRILFQVRGPNERVVAGSSDLLSPRTSCCPWRGPSRRPIIRQTSGPSTFRNWRRKAPIYT